MSTKNKIPTTLIYKKYDSIIMVSIGTQYPRGLAVYRKERCLFLLPFHKIFKTCHIIQSLRKN